MFLEKLLVALLGDLAVVFEEPGPVILLGRHCVSFWAVRGLRKSWLDIQEVTSAENPVPRSHPLDVFLQGPGRDGRIDALAQTS